MGNTLDDDGLAHLKKMSDDDLVKNAGTVDMAVLVEATLRLKNSSERLERFSKVLVVLTRWLIGLTIALIIVTVPLVVHDLSSKWW